MSSYFHSGENRFTVTKSHQRTFGVHQNNMTLVGGQVSTVPGD